jgi:hypothetical protein
MKWVTLTNSLELPNAWDLIATDNIFLKKSFLSHLQEVNPCQQSYSYLEDNGSLKAIYVDYRLKLDIFTYSFMHLKMPIRIMGIPCSVSRPGFVILSGFESQVMSHFHAKKGAKLILNSDVELPERSGVTLPTCKLSIKYSNLNDFLQAMRSPYRYRLNKAAKKWAGVTVECLPMQKFDHELYELYEQVQQKSDAKLEKLSLDFFSRLPLPAKLLKASFQGKLLGFVVVIENQQELFFLFTGFDYSLQVEFDIYLNLLLEIVKYGAEGGFKVIDLGQTAEETKMKLGARLFPKSMYLSHSNPLLQTLANNFINIFSYKPPNFDFHVFKEKNYSIPYKKD